MKMKFLLIGLMFLCTILSFTSSIHAQAAFEDGKLTPVDTSKDEKSKQTAKYAPDNSNYCSAIMITPNVGLTAKHCVGNMSKEGYVGAVYPGQSGTSTPFGYMNISSYIPDSAEDIAIIKGKDSDKSGDYKHYIQGFKTNLKAFSLEERKKLIGKKVYSYGYPSDLTGSPQVKAEGVITNYNPVTRDIDTTMPVSNGQSGAGVFLEDGNQFIGILTSGYKKNDKDYARVTVIDNRLLNWFNQNILETE
ncbi:trypsin-like serine peptidase [Staphylococcus ratti]|uniref:Serine protease n=1 Tax=Staphylococcus ratti TaxID=2892440 RepID=A0ABY3PEW9_9STAP|nr:serine protease [Staphylococcus ratti]UEX90848.1 serine protease [Staphylococcus ratti]